MPIQTKLASRIVLLAAGVPDYRSLPSVGPIACAVDDASEFYRSLARAAGEYFDGGSSVVVSSPTALEMRQLIELKSRECGPDALLVVYFSGHGEQAEGDVAIVLEDADERGRGRLTSNELAAVARHSSVVFVLDCCSSGGALGAANQSDPFLSPRASVIASARFADYASHSRDGSAFTQALCRAIDGLADSGDDLTILALAEHVRGDDGYEGEFLINVAEGQADLLLAPVSDIGVKLGDFVSKFVERQSAGDRRYREVMWYSLTALP
ncbi:MAG: caspase family protein, partial [Actinomycetia bacterium]|nr:caspase family protein [Actinomycetes bacterium]